ncbi:glycosyl hydrolase family 65 protein [Paenibacillus sp. GCM10027626]|uniref:glycosyl hydrolase family 65 protein n=1 Tax=Paenibacillus sp. GCM10027626 TaxID=3273411 RepID=UPI003624C3D9
MKRLGSSVAANSWRTIYFEFPEELDMTAYPILSLQFNGWGGAPGTNAYTTRLAVLTADNQRYEKNYNITPDSWNALSMNISDWEFSSRVKRIEVSYKADSSAAWNAAFQIDDVKRSNAAGETLKRNYLGNWHFELPWNMGNAVAGMAVTEQTLAFPGGGYGSNSMRGLYMLEAASTNVPGNQYRSVYKTLSGEDWTNEPIALVHLNTWGGAPGLSGGYGAKYWAKVKVFSNANVFEQTQAISPNAWNEIQLDVSEWAFKNNVTKIEVGMWADTTQTWSNKFQVDTLIRRSDTFPVFSGSNATYMDRLNRMFQMHWFTDPGLNGAKSGRGIKATWWREWDTLANSWIDTNKNRFYGDDANEDVRALLLNTPMFDNGFVLMYGEEARNQLGQFFPTYQNSNGKSAGWEFDGTTKEGWTSYNVANDSVAARRWYMQTEAADPQLVSPVLTVDSYNMPYLLVRMASSNANTTGAVYFSTSASPGFSEEKKVTFKVINDGKYHNYHIPMYTHAEWNGTITQLRLDPAESGSPGGWVLIDYINGSYDVSWYNNPFLILGSSRYYKWTGDTAFLQAQMPRLRSAIHYMNDTLKGATNGYIFSSYNGHDGTSGLSPATRTGYGIGGGYWDLLPSGHKDLYATVYYYAALTEMNKLEELVQLHPEWNIPANPYGEDAAVIASYRDKVASEVTEDSLFWNNTTKRYVPLVDAAGLSHDFGYTFMNLEALYYGLGNAARGKDIFDWIDGVRTVAGDTSTGADIYFHGFAPRASTKRNTDWYVWTWEPHAFPWGGQVQDGGAVLYEAYYDVMARLKYKNTDNAWNRMKGVLDWYQATQDEGGYRWYYAQRNLSLQGAGSAGGIGVDADFTDATIAALSAFYGFMGVDADVDALVVAPKLPADLTWMQVTHVNYRGSDAAIYGSAERTQVTLTTEGAPLTIKIGDLAANQAYTVYRDGSPWTTVTADASGFAAFQTGGSGRHEYKINK